MKMVTGIPAKARASATLWDASTTPAMQGDNAGSALQIFFPAHSVNPAQKPQGGAEFYAAPLDISDARNVTFGYSVFFPADFDWVLAGKLPGLYGGHTGCSGGNAALDCFSTRLMWRPDGAGELYLYAPKDKQPKQLCSAPGSTCDAAYGLSIGRGSFNWVAGAWTTVRQTVFLNTPGKQDGSFVLDVNGERVIDRNDVFYREDLSSGSGESDTKTTHAPTKTTSKKDEKPTSSSTDDGGLLGPILGGLLGDLGLRDGGLATHDIEAPSQKERDLEPSGSVTFTATPTAATNTDSQTATILPEPTISSPQPTTMTSTTTDDSFGIESAKETEVKLVGIFFRWVEIFL
ncbi:hypothetical protein BDZ97DRAFT_361600 [Flammula alnicola]|nr:hypothetical protein BDZ97DRAFT_361600 [Flammula alnicola]